MFLLKMIFGGVFGAVGKVAGYLNQRGVRQVTERVAGINSTLQTWKDEFITVVWMSPVIMVMFAAFFGMWVIFRDPVIPSHEKAKLMIDSVMYSLQALNGLPAWYQEILFWVVMAGIGIYTAVKGKEKFGKANGKKPGKDNSGGSNPFSNYGG